MVRKSLSQHYLQKSLNMSSENTDKKTYKDSLKATSLFGGVQLVNILIQLVKSKIIAILLGPSGMGIYGLFTQTEVLIRSCTSFGLSSSAVRNISEARATNDKNRIISITSIFRRIIWITGLFGTLVCLWGAPIWSKIAFGNYHYTLGFVVLSIGMLFQQLTLGRTAIFQGLQKYSMMAKSNVIGNFLGLLVSVPLYFIWKVDAIVPVLMLSSLTALLVTNHFFRKLQLPKAKIDKLTFTDESKNMIIMGLSISLSGIVETIVAYYIRIYIGNVGGLSEVGLFTAGFAIVETYIGLIMTSMGSDYYPRLSGVSHNKAKFNETINSQLEISLLLIAPIISIFIILLEIVIALLYSEKFLPAEGMMLWAVYGCFFKAVSWCLSYAILSKGDYKAFIYNELGAKIYTVPLKLLGYSIGGLTGIGIAYLAGYIIYAIQVYLVCHNRYGVDVGKNVVKLFLKYLPFLTICLIVTINISDFKRYIIGLPFVFICFIFSYRELIKIVDIKSFINSKIKK